MQVTKGFLITILILAAILMDGCYLMYGYKPIASFEWDSYNKFIEANADNTIPTTSSISTVTQFTCFRGLFQDSLSKESFSGQPVQILYFQKDSLISYHINCLAAGKLSGLDWNTDDRFSNFPPKSAITTPTIGITFQDMLNTFELQKPKTTYSVIVCWTSIFPKISESAVKTVKNNILRYGDTTNVTLFLINTDNYYIEKMKQ